MSHFQKLFGGCCVLVRFQIRNKSMLSAKSGPAAHLFHNTLFNFWTTFLLTFTQWLNSHQWVSIFISKLMIIYRQLLLFKASRSLPKLMLKEFTNQHTGNTLMKIQWTCWLNSLELLLLSTRICTVMELQFQQLIPNPIGQRTSAKCLDMKTQLSLNWCVCIWWFTAITKASNYFIEFNKPQF